LCLPTTRGGRRARAFFLAWKPRSRAGKQDAHQLALAARAGLGELVLVDKDPLAASNLNRVRGLTRLDVGEVKSKALKTFIEGIGLAVKVAAIASDVDTDPAAVDALASCDVLIGCTDDFAGRELMNVSLYAYAQALIRRPPAFSSGEL